MLLEDEVIVLPGEWAMIEALFMIPIVKNVLEYRKTIAALATGKKKTRDLQESVNMEPLVSAVRAARADMNDPIKAELHLRHWHVLATSGVPGFSPGHFKITHNTGTN